MIACRSSPVLGFPVYVLVYIVPDLPIYVVFASPTISLNSSHTRSLPIPSSSTLASTGCVYNCSETRVYKCFTLHSWPPFRVSKLHWFLWYFSLILFTIIYLFIYTKHHFSSLSYGVLWNHLYCFHARFFPNYIFKSSFCCLIHSHLQECFI